jgi:prophage DNA circulation protein
VNPAILSSSNARAPAWYAGLQKAAFRGIPFAVRSSDSHWGRRIAVHEYPYRDTPWVEDLGRSTRRLTVSGFLISNSLIYGGGDVIAQRARMVAACETAGTAILVHPTLGQISVNLAADGFNISERWDAGRYFEIVFNLIESGALLFPSIGTATGDLVGEAASKLDEASASRFSARLGAMSLLGQAVFDALSLASRAFGALVDRAACDATRTYNMLGELPGIHGLYAGSGNQNVLGSAGASAPRKALKAAIPQTAQSLTSTAAVTRSTVGSAIAAMDVAGAAGGAFAGALQAAIAALAKAVVNPADGLRLFADLSGFTPDNSAPGAQAGAAQGAAGDLARRAAIAALGRAVAAYQPSSYDDAAAARTFVVTVIEREITIAGDNAEDDTYNALRVLHQAVVQDLNTRGASLAPMKIFTLHAPLPSLAVAYRLYQDMSRSDSMVLQSRARHPAFMPTSFLALAR